MHCFGPFEVDFTEGELRREGAVVRLAEPTWRLLGKLLERPGEMLTLEELQEALGASEHAVRTAAAALRTALEDEADPPVYLETVGRQGYRFLAPVRLGVPPPGRAARRNQVQRLTVTIAIIAVGALLSVVAWTFRRQPSPVGDVGSIHFVVNLPEGTQLAAPSFAPQMAISKNGRLLAVVLTHTPSAAAPSKRLIFGCVRWPPIRGCTSKAPMARRVRSGRRTGARSASSPGAS